MSEKMREALIAYIEAGVGNSTDYEKQADALRLAVEALAEQPAISCAAIRTLQHFGYSYHGGALWKPPIGERPTWLAEQPTQGAHSPFANSENSVETHAGSRQPAQGEVAAIYMGHRHAPEGTKEFWGLSDKPMEEGTKLYTAPPAPSVPDEMASSPTHGEYSSGFVNGWNHCRAAMLAASPEPRS